MAKSKSFPNAFIRKLDKVETYHPSIDMSSTRPRESLSGRGMFAPGADRRCHLGCGCNASLKTFSCFLLPLAHGGRLPDRKGLPFARVGLAPTGDSVLQIAPLLGFLGPFSFLFCAHSCTLLRWPLVRGTSPINHGDD